MEFIYRGCRRPLIYIPNYGNIFIEEGDVLHIIQSSSDNNTFRIYKKGVFDYPSYHRYMCFLSNLIPKTHGLVLSADKKIEILNSIIEGKELTILEYEISCMTSIENNLPKSSISLSHYQFTNDTRPISRYVYKEGLYYGSNYEKGGTSKQLSWYIYRNLFKVFPYNKEKVSYKEWEKAPTPY